ncbi:MAG: phage tail protein [Clostridiaceae bacterium]|nr:phage tail protein [Clostridiaceae bacterium]
MEKGKENLIEYGLENCHMAVIESYEDGVYTFGTPIPVPGAVNLTMTAQTAQKIFYADNKPYYTTTTNSGYDGSLEVAQIPLKIQTDVLGDEADANGVIIDGGNTQAKETALLFEFSGDVKKTRHILWRCKLAKPDIAGKTTEAETDPQTQTMKITAMPRADIGRTHGRVSNETETKAVYDAWFDSVYEPDFAVGE